MAERTTQFYEEEIVIDAVLTLKSISGALSYLFKKMKCQKNLNS